jgi:glutamyl-tRNA synthetase
MTQFCEWFDLDHITSSAAQFNTEKLNWLNAHYIKQADLGFLVAEVSKRLDARGVETGTQLNIPDVIGLYRERVNALNELAESVIYFYQKPKPDVGVTEKHITPDVLPVIKTLAQHLATIEWTTEAIHVAIEHAVTSNQLKFQKVAMPLRVMLTGGTQSPSIDAVMTLLGQEETLSRINAYV